MIPTVRFAPSPTGFLHIGNLRPALFNWLYARRYGGRFLLRFDDTDIQRSKPEYAEAILQDLRWIGIATDWVERQSDRLAQYDAAADSLRASGVLYPCWETPEELERRRKRQMARGLPPIYGREALRLTEAERAAHEAEGRRPHWRFRLPNFTDDPARPERTELHWDDLVRGRQTVDLGSLSDPVLVREDGSYLYTLTSVVDDGAFGITHVIRGDDHVTNTGVQIAIFEALGLPVPVFGHHNLITTIDGEGLSKRTGALSLRALRQDGYEPMAVASLATLVGLPGAIEALPDLDALAARVDLTEGGSSASKFDPAELDRLNADLVHAMPYAAAAERLRAFCVPDAEAEAFWLAVRGNCTRVADAALWRDVVYGAVPPTAPAGEDAVFLGSAAALLPPAPWDGAAWKAWTGKVKELTGRKGRALFMPLRLALTGLDHGPEMSELLPLIGRDRAVARLTAAAARQEG
ncbi:glutamate--tRNA ligase [Mangrovibrevibacter kandeliae]|uniref:glutamate--tRNA ligase n=1 Tax=Mangrovibrevibacter kandeliae TaxID=2968473 RepID=UPI0021172FB5|nr:glutamate--tRNA ligase [Aurantimonas sp. CSK15Z-1]MCQ8782802.1 glutamate--tRNA ligase [Aurantimonas sp. CSK15Z-1]